MYDLLVGVITLITVVVSALDRWPFGDVGCSFSAVFISTSFLMSILSLTFLNIERYIAVTRPLKFPILVYKTLCNNSRCGTSSWLVFWTFVTAEYFDGEVVCM